MAPVAIVVMGVSGSGKSTIASLLATRLSWQFADGDAFHPAANVAKMGRGIALADDDRWPWLDAIAAWIDARRVEGCCCVIACSALKRAYRERLSQGRGDVQYVYLKAGYDLVASRMATRTGHYMPLALLQSQYDALEEPGPGENSLTVGVEAAPDQVVAAVVAEIARKR